MIEKPKNAISIRIDDENLRHIKAMAKARNFTTSKMINLAVSQYLESTARGATTSFTPEDIHLVSEAVKALGLKRVKLEAFLELLAMRQK